MSRVAVTTCTPINYTDDIMLDMLPPVQYDSYVSTTIIPE